MAPHDLLSPYVTRGEASLVLPSAVLEAEIEVALALPRQAIGG
jgi:hypothetical protein